MARVLALLFCRPRGKLAYLVRVAHSLLPTALGLGVSTQGAVGLWIIDSWIDSWIPSLKEW